MKTLHSASTLIPQALQIADETMIEVICSNGLASAGAGHRFALVDERHRKVSTLEAADPALSDAFAWLNQRGRAALITDGNGVFIEILPAPDDLQWERLNTLNRLGGSSPTLVPNYAGLAEKRMSELSALEKDDARELWLRTNVGHFDDHTQRHLQFLFDRLDVARSVFALPLIPSDPDETEQADAPAP